MTDIIRFPSETTARKEAMELRKRLRELCRAVDIGAFHHPSCDWNVGRKCNCAREILVSTAQSAKAYMDQK